jgi:hypothetical protein
MSDPTGEADLQEAVHDSETGYRYGSSGSDDEGDDGEGGGGVGPRGGDALNTRSVGRQATRVRTIRD